MRCEMIKGMWAKQNFKYNKAACTEDISLKAYQPSLLIKKKQPNRAFFPVAVRLDGDKIK